MFAAGPQGLETPERVYISHEDGQNQQVDTVPLKQGGGSSTGHSRASNIQYHIAGAPVIPSPKSGQAPAQPQPARGSPAYRAG